MKYTDAEILGMIDIEEGRSYGIYDAELADQREKAIKYYNGEPLGNEQEGRSQVVSRDVLETIESALPQILKVFVSGTDVVKFNPRGIEDIEAAEQESEYINYVVMEKNPGYQIFATWFKDAMLSKNGYVKVWYENEEEVEEETYNGLTDMQLTMLLNDPNIEVLEHSEQPDEQAAQQLAQAIQMGQADPNTPMPMIHDVKIAVKNEKECIRITNVPPEDIMVSVDCRDISLQKAYFVQHRSRMTIEEMEEQGWDVPDNLGDTYDENQEELARDLYDESQNLLGTKDLLVTDNYIMLDGKRKRFVVCSNHILYREDAEIVPIVAITPHIMPHRHIGMSYADLCIDIQEIKTALIRGQLDNMYLSNNGRHAISDKVNLSDMLTSRPGGVVRVKGNPGMEIMPLSHTPFPPMSFTMVEYIDNVKERRTGITAYNQGLDVNSLNKTASGITQIMSASQQRMEMVARTFAETGVKDLFMMVHRLVRKYYTKPDIMRIRNKFVDVDPRQWKTRTDMSISVGLGTGNKDQMLQHLMLILQAQQQGLPLGLATPKNIYNALAKLTENAGFKNVEEFWTDPENAQQQPQQPSPEQVKAQADMQIKQAEMQFNAQLEQAKQQHAMEIETIKAQSEASKAEIEAQMKAAEMEYKQQIDLANLEFDKWKAELDANTKIVIAEMQSKTTRRSRG